MSDETLALPLPAVGSVWRRKSDWMLAEVMDARPGHARVRQSGVATRGTWVRLALFLDRYEPFEVSR